MERVPLGDRPVTVVRPADWQVLREIEAEHGRDAPYWAILWPSGEALAQAVADEPPSPGARVLELGCGLALPSVAAARAGADVLATDGSTDAIAFAAHTLALDEQVGDVAAIDWREPRLLLERGPWDLVLAADVLYLQANVLTTSTASAVASRTSSAGHGMPTGSRPSAWAAAHSRWLQAHTTAKSPPAITPPNARSSRVVPSAAAASTLDPWSISASIPSRLSGRVHTTHTSRSKPAHTKKNPSLARHGMCAWYSWVMQTIHDTRMPREKDPHGSL